MKLRSKEERDQILESQGPKQAKPKSKGGSRLARFTSQKILCKACGKRVYPTEMTGADDDVLSFSPPHLVTAVGFPQGLLSLLSL